MLRFTDYIYPTFYVVMISIVMVRLYFIHAYKCIIRLIHHPHVACNQILYRQDTGIPTVILLKFNNAVYC